MTPLDLSLRHLPAWQAEGEALLRELVCISSHSADRIGCQAMATALIPLFTLPGLRVRRYPDKSGVHGDHLAFFSDAAGDPEEGEARAPFTLLIGHLDTVFPAASFSGYWEEEAGGLRYARGPGVYDMKGGLVVMHLALRALAAEGLLAQVPLRGVVVSDEEVGSPSSQEQTRRIARGAACALGFESGRAGDAIITRRKGIGGVVVQAQGKAAHAGNLHHEGKNAIWALARFIDRAQGLTDYDRGVTVNVGLVQGGISRNTVPDQAEAQLDFRYITLADARYLEQALAREAQAVEGALPGTRLFLQGGAYRPPLERTPASQRLYEAYAACQRAAGLSASEAPLLGGGSDASTVAPLGIPAIDGLAPRGSGFHTREERMELGTMVPKAEALVRFLLTAQP